MSQQGESFYRALLDNLHDGVYFTDTFRRITFWNGAAERITGYSSGEVLGRPCSANILRHVDEEGTEMCETFCPLAGTIADGIPREAGRVYLHHKSGCRIPISVRVFPVRDERGDIVGAVEFFRDNSLEIMLGERIKELESLTLLDPLTKLGNRRFLQIHLESRIAEFHRYGLGFGVLFLDIDHFKNINDIYGHHMGDRVLAMVANTFSRNFRPFDISGRWGGEEFIGITPNVGEKALSALAQRLRRLIKHSFISENGRDPISVTVSIGATLCRAGDCVETLIRRADTLMYQSKREGRNRVTFG